MQQTIIQISPDSPQWIIDATVELYRSIFGAKGEDNPWGEGYKCQVCGTYWALDGDFPSQHCGLDLVDFHPVDVVREYIMQENMEMYVALHQENDAGEWQVVGFAGGMAMDSEQLETYLEAPGLAERLPMRANQKALYKAELGVREDMRGEDYKWAKRLYAARQRGMLLNHPDMIVEVLRSRPEAKTALWHMQPERGGVKAFDYAEIDAKDPRLIIFAPMRFPEKEGKLISLPTRATR